MTAKPKPHAKDDRDAVRYNLTLPGVVNDALEESVAELGISRAEAVRRALLLFRHAVKADKVELTKNDEKQTVLLK